MKIHFLAAPLLALSACNPAPPANDIQDVAANNMIADDVTELQDDSASVPSGEAAPGDRANSEEVSDDAGPPNNDRAKR